MQRIVVAGAIVLAGIGLAVGDTTPTPQSTPKSSVDDPVICKRTVTTGSHFPSKTCMKKSQWEALRKEGQEVVDQHHQINPTQPGAGG